MSWNRIVGKPLAIYFISACCLAVGALADTTVYVDGSVAVTGDGSQAKPLKTITEALALMDTPLIILVAGGSYADETPYTEIFSDQTLIGSYDSSFTTSDPAATPTVIDMARLPQIDQSGTFYVGGATGWTLENLVIQNSTTGDGGDTENGGAMYVRKGSNGTLRGVTFLHCGTRFEGGSEGGAAREGGAVCIRDASTVVFEDCIFDRCTAVGGGGAVRLRSAGSGNTAKFYRCLFSRCGARNNASVIDDGDGSSQIEIVNCIFAHNGVDVVLPAGTFPSNYLIRVADKQTRIYNCTFVSNNNPAGYMFSIGDSGQGGATKEIVNCIIADNTIGDDANPAAAIFNYADGYNENTMLENNLFYSNSDLDPLDPAGTNIINVNGNVAGDPLFVDAPNDDYHLQSGSPGEDAGQTLTPIPDDFMGKTRPVGSAHDLGALEGQNIPFYMIPNVVTAASSSFNADSVPERTVDGSGLNALDQHDTLTANMWVSDMGQESPAWIQYEFDIAYKLDQMLVWNANNELEWFLGWGVKTATVEYSKDGTTWITLADVPEFTQASGSYDYTYSTTVDFMGATAKFVKITCDHTWGGGNQCSLSEVRFSYVPVVADAPHPVNGAGSVSPDTVMRWTAGRDAVWHEIHLGLDMQAVTDSMTPLDTVSEAVYTTDLQPDTTYYWKVVEVNEAENPSAWSSPVWSFSTSPHVVVDNFERYGQVSPSLVFQTWLDSLGYAADAYFPDGYPGNGTGAIVGYDATVGPVMEHTNVYGGNWSMPLFFAGVSETMRTFEPARNWTWHGSTKLVVHFYGTADNIGQLYVKIGSTKIPYTGSAADIATEAWTVWEIDLASSGAALTNVTSLSIGVDGTDARGKLYIDDILLR